MPIPKYQKVTPKPITIADLLNNVIGELSIKQSEVGFKLQRHEINKRAGYLATIGMLLRFYDIDPAKTMCVAWSDPWNKMRIDAYGATFGPSLVFDQSEQNDRLSACLRYLIDCYSKLKKETVS